MTECSQSKKIQSYPWRANISAMSGWPMVTPAPNAIFPCFSASLSSFFKIRLIPRPGRVKPFCSRSLCHQVTPNLNWVPLREPNMKKCLYVGWLPPPGETKEFLESRGIELLMDTKDRHLTEDELLAIIGDADATLAGGDPYSKRVIDSAPMLKIIARAG